MEKNMRETKKYRDVQAPGYRDSEAILVPELPMLLLRCKVPQYPPR